MTQISTDPLRGRPQGEIRSAICDTLRQQGPMALIDLVQRVNVQTTQLAISQTVKNAVRSGQLEKVGHEKRAHCNKWIAVYDVVETKFAGDRQQDHGGIFLLGGVMRDWR